jgi:hypothetical protein
MSLVGTGKLEAVSVGTKFAIIQACENCNMSKSKIGRCYNLSSTLIMILKYEDKIKSAVLK